MMVSKRPVLSQINYILILIPLTHSECSNSSEAMQEDKQQILNIHNSQSKPDLGLNGKAGSFYPKKGDGI